MTILFFLTKLIISGGLLYGYYQLFLRNKRFHHYNRFYLLAIALLSLAIPFIKIPVSLFWGGQQHSTLIQTLRVINANGWEEPVTIYANQNQWARWINLQSSLYVIYIAGVMTGLFLLVRSLVWIRNLQIKYPHQTIDQLKIYNTREPGTPFSFFKSIFWDEKISFNDKNGQQIFRHELFHVKEKHSADVLLLEILCCIFWFNPFFHLIKKEIKAIHEFLADEYAVSASNRYDYAELLLTHAITQNKLSLTNPFFHNQIKRRITMITQSSLIRRSGYISRMMALPLLFLLVSAFAVKITNKQTASASHYAVNNITVVIDPGHGGSFPGGSNIGMLEKDINLEISQKIKQLAAEYNVNIVLTRNDDKLVGNATTLREDLLNRVKISDEAKPDLFISIHVNQTYNKDKPIEEDTYHTGFEAYISGKQENPKARQFASAVLGEIKNIYPVQGTIKQREEGIVVIDRTSYPCILLECGFLNNPKDFAFITNKDNQEKIARKILEGIVKYSDAQTNGSIIQKDTFVKVTYTMEDQTKADTMMNVRYINHSNSSALTSKMSTTDDTKSSRTKDTVPAVIFTKVEFEPDFPGGQAGWVKYLTQHLKYPDAAVKKKIEGTVLLEFIVNTDGKITDIKAISGPEELKESSILVIKQSGVWIPAKQNGLKVKAYKRQPITYKLS